MVQVKVTKTSGAIDVPEGLQTIGTAALAPNTSVIIGELIEKPSGSTTLEFGALVPLARSRATVNTVFAVSKLKVVK